MLHNFWNLFYYHTRDYKLFKTGNNNTKVSKYVQSKLYTKHAFNTRHFDILKTTFLS